MARSDWNAVSRGGCGTMASIFWCLVVFPTFVTVTRSLIIIPVDSSQKDAYDTYYGYSPIFDDGSSEEGRGKRVALYASPAGSEPLPSQYSPAAADFDYFVVKRYLRSSRRSHENEGKESRPGLPLRFGKRSLARYMLGRVIVNSRKAKEPVFVTA